MIAIFKKCSKNEKNENDNAWFLSAIPPKSPKHWKSFMRLSPPGTHFTAESTEAMQIKCLAQGNNILLLGFELSTSVSKTDILANRPICPEKQEHHILTQQLKFTTSGIKRYERHQMVWKVLNSMKGIKWYERY